MRLSRGSQAIAIALGAALFVAACGGDDSGSSSDTTTASSAGDTTVAETTTTAAAVPKGGTLTIGAEQEPDCMDWIASCAGSSWGNWMAKVQTIPTVYVVRKVNDVWTPVISPVMASEPELVTSPKQVITYKISPDAKWSDGTAITSADFKYTGESIRDGDDIYDKTGYDKIESIETPDPATAVVTMKEAYASWKNLFSGGYGLLPSHLLEGKDRAALMKDGYDWSGGPWKIEKWEKGVSITLVPNDAYFGTKPNLDKVIFQFTTDTAAAFQAFKAGQVSALYPQPQLDAIDQIKAGLSDANSVYTAETGNIEALWINNSKAPFDSKAVRQAFSYAIDRDAIVKRLFGDLGVDKAAQSFNPALVAKYAEPAFSTYTLDLKKVDELMTGDGWAKGSDGIWAKGGTRATIEMKTTAGNKRRELTQQVLQTQLKDAGFELTINNAKAGDLFGQMLPAGDYTLALYAQVATFTEPGLSTVFDSKNIPSDANGNSGQNWTRTNIPAADPLLRQVDTELDDAKRVTASKEADKLLADDATSLPLDPLPNILLWSKKVVGPVSDNPVEGGFWNLNEWGLAS